MKFPTAPGDSYLTTELAQALVAAGHEVEVLLIDWDAQSSPIDGPVKDWNGLRIVRCAPRLVEGFGGLVRNASKFLLTALHARRLVRRHFNLAAFDTFVAWSPALAFGSCVGLMRKAGIARRLLFIWDFFPDHQRDIGYMSGGLSFKVARALEQRLMDQFNILLCTLPQNAAYLRREFRVRPDQTVALAPIWSDAKAAPKADRLAVRRTHALPEDRPIAVFGGQLVEGRGFDQILAAAAVGRERGSRLCFLFVGGGRLEAKLRTETCDNILWLPTMPRDAYLELLTVCEVGMVATVPGLSSFSIPSKTLDYLRAGLPVVAALEPGSEFAALLEQYGVGRAAPFADGTAFFEAAEALASSPSIQVAAQVCLDEVFHVRHTVMAVVGSV
jgi:glycosyltransferase involved in cell wall biosynthesis